MARTSITKEMADRAAKLYAEHGSFTKAAKAAGISRTSLMRHFQAHKLGFKIDVGNSGGSEAEAETPPPVEIPISNTERMKYEDRIRALQKQLKDTTKTEVTAEMIGAYYFDLKERPLEEPDWLIHDGAVSGSIPGVPVVNWSDWHYGEYVDPAQVEGANSFDIPIFDRRFNTLVDRTIDLCFNHMVGGENYPGIVVNLGGDMLSGNIHEELHQTNQTETIPAVLDLSGKIAWGLKQLADKFGRVRVVGVPGNHGRNTKKPQAKNACYTSFDWMICKMLESQFKDDDRFHFFIPNGFDAYYRVYGHRILLTHGDRTGAKGGDGFIGVIGPVMRGAGKVRLSYSARGREIDTILMGHWHNYLPLPGVRVNNCLKGYDEWALSMRFTPTPPSQDLFFIHPKRDITCSWPVQLEGPQNLIENVSWTSWKE